MTGKLLRNLPLSACFVAAVAVAEPLTSPVASDQAAFELITSADAGKKREDFARSVVDDLLDSREEIATDRFYRWRFVLEREPTGVLTEIVNKPAEDASWWRSSIGVTDWQSVLYAMPGDRGAR